MFLCGYPYKVTVFFGSQKLVTHKSCVSQICLTTYYKIYGATN
jgi:hypothetical protein